MSRSVVGTYYQEPRLEERDRTAVLERAVEANRLWWRLHLDRWELRVKRYGVGEEHGEHTDWHPAGGGCRKFSVNVQLSEPDSYSGGSFRIRHWGHDLAPSRARGTLAAYPGWVYHRVTPVTGGERWSLLIQGHRCGEDLDGIG